MMLSAERRFADPRGSQYQPSPAGAAAAVVAVLCLRSNTDTTAYLKCET